MSEKDVVENVDSPGEIAIPIADNTTPGIASFDSNDFTVGPDGKVSSIVERGIPQYLGKITGTGTNTTDLNWEVDWKSRPTIKMSNGEEEVDKAKRIKIGEYIMLTEHFNQFVPGDIFRITNVQIEGSKYTVKTNNVRALSLASIVGPQGEQGLEGEQGVPYLAYTSNIESTTDPAAGVLMYLEDGHFNRTPVVKQGEYRDVVTVDWYNKTTHRAFMVTGLIQYKNSDTNQWVAQITAATDITGAVGPQGKEGAGIADIVDIDYPHGEFISVQYDTTDGIKMQGIAEYLRDDGETYQIPTDIDVPLVAGVGISIDKKEQKKKVEIKSLNSNLENGEGQGSVKMSLSGCSAKGAFAFATGYYTNADVGSTYAGGYYSKASVQYSIAYGISTRTQNGILAAFGKYNKPTTGDIFEVGNGSSNNRLNAFAVLADGRAKVQTAPLEENDVVNLQYIKARFAALNDGTAIPDDADLNNYMTPGNYTYLGMNIKNAPPQQSLTKLFRMYVLAFNSDGAGAYRQIVISAENTIYWRSITDGFTTEWYKFTSGGEFITPSTATSDATSGTFTADEWSKLQASMNNKILFNNEIYRLNDPGHTPGIWSYVHTGWDGTDIMDKSINVTVATGAWTLVMGQKAGGKLYRHDVTFTPNTSDADLAEMDEIHVTIYSQSNAQIDTVEKYLNAAGDATVCAGISSSMVYDGSAAIGAMFGEYIAWIYKQQDAVFVKQATISSDNMQSVFDTVTEL